MASVAEQLPFVIPPTRRTKVGPLGGAEVHQSGITVDVRLCMVASANVGLTF
jgi:hypothetical protein